MQKRNHSRQMLLLKRRSEREQRESLKKREIIVQNIKEVEKVIDAKCELDPNVVSILNEAAKKP